MGNCLRFFYEQVTEMALGYESKQALQLQEKSLLIRNVVRFCDCCKSTEKI